MRYNAQQVEMMRSEISDDDFMRWVQKHPGTYELRRGIHLSSFVGKVRDVYLVYVGVMPATTFTFPCTRLDWDGVIVLDTNNTIKGGLNAKVRGP